MAEVQEVELTEDQFNLIEEHHEMLEKHIEIYEQYGHEELVEIVDVIHTISDYGLIILALIVGGLAILAIGGRKRAL